MAAKKSTARGAKGRKPAARTKPKPRTAKRTVQAIQKQKYSKTQILKEIAQNTNLTRKEVSAVLEQLEILIERHIKKRSIGEFTLPGLLKIRSVVRPARPARKGVPNPFAPGELMNIAAKPKSNRVKVMPLKKLKDFVL